MSAPIVRPRTRWGMGLAVLAFLALAPRVGASGSSGAWQMQSAPSQGGGATAYDESRQLMYVVGGEGTSCVYTVGTNGAPAEWRILQTVGTPPSPRFGHCLVYDPERDRLIVFGGQDYEGHFLNDIWQLTLSGTPRWSLLPTTGTPPEPRSKFGAFYDPSFQRLFIFGGVDSTGIPLPNNLFQLYLPGNPAGWYQTTPTGDIPSARSGFSFSSCPNRNCAILFGGNDGVSDLNDAYKLDLSSGWSWIQLSTTGIQPDPRSDHFGACDPEDDLMWVWGGTAADDSVRALSLASLQWVSQPNTGWQGAPSGHTHPIGVHVSWTSRFQVLDGAENCELWEFCGNQGEPLSTYWQNIQSPGALAGSAFALDRVHGRAYLFGGVDENGTLSNSFWEYSLTNPKGWSWAFLRSLTMPDIPALKGACAVWDQKRARVLVYGGQTADYRLSNRVYCMADTMGGDFFTYPVIRPTGTPPPGRVQHAAIYDPVGDRVLVFGGLDTTGYYNRGLYQLSLSPSPAWSRLVVAGGPSARAGHTAVYDEPHHRMIVFGGVDSVGSVKNDVWALNLPGGTWTQLAPTGTPPLARYEHTAVFDSRRDRMLVYGGHTITGDSADTWELDLASGTPAWSRLLPALAFGRLPLGRYQHAAVYDSIGDRMLCYGGMYRDDCAICQEWPQRTLWSLQFGGSVVSVAASVLDRPWMVGAPAPNPARGSTRLAFQLSRATTVRAEVYDVAGRRLRVLADGPLDAGQHEVGWDGRDAAGGRVSSGMYFYRLELGGQAESRKVMLVR
jgi:hypothetical protein